MKARSSQSSIKQTQSKLPWYRRWLARIWLTYGGGLYAVGYATTFLILEARSIVGGIAESNGLADFLTSEILEFFFRFLGDSIGNMVHAFTWFLPVISYRSPLGIILLGFGFWLFDIYLRKPVGDWLLREKSGAAPKAVDR